MNCFKIFISTLLIHGLTVQSSPITESSRKINFMEDAHGIDTEFANLLTNHLSSQECLLMYIFFISVNSDKTLGVTGKLDDILSKRSELLRSPKWQRFGEKECFSSFKRWATKMRETETIGSDIEMKLLIGDGLVLLNRTDLKEKVDSLYNRRKHKEIEVGLEEIKRHGSINQSIYPSFDDMINSRKFYEEDGFIYKVLVFIVVLSVLILMIVEKSLKSFLSKRFINLQPKENSKN